MDDIKNFADNESEVLGVKLFQTTVFEICRFLNAEKKIEDKKISGFCVVKENATKDYAFIAIKSKNYDVNKYAEIAIAKGCTLIISEFQIKDYDCIIVENARAAMALLAIHFKSYYNFLAIGITGSYGKTTAKDMTHLVLSESMNAIKTNGSANNTYAVANTIFTLNKNTQSVVFEMGMNYSGVISQLSKMVNPRISVITNIGYSHIQYLKTQEGILNAKLEILDGMNENDYILINKDDELLTKANLPKCHKITFGIKDHTADFYASHIVSYDTFIEFNIIHEHLSTAVVLNCVGEHNVYNALIAFAIGKLADIPKSNIVKGLSKYRTNGIRQNISKYEKKTVIADCYNASPESMESAIKVLCDYKLEHEGRRVAVLADMLELGDLSAELHKKVGKIINDSNINLLFCYGKDSKYFIDEVKNPRCQSLFLESSAALTEVLSLNLRDNDVILFKGSHGMKLETIMDKVINKFKQLPLVTNNDSGLFNKVEDITAKSYILTDLKTGNIILEKNSDQRVRPAGLTKILTAIASIEMGNLNDIITVEEKELSHGVTCAKSSKLGLKPGQRIKLIDLLYSFLIASGNDGSNVICRHIFGSIDKAIEFLNVKAKQIGALDSSFMNVHGIDHDNHYTTAKDMLKIVNHAMKNLLFRDIISQTKFTLNPLNDEPREFTTTNHLINKKHEGKYYYPYATGIKAGQTPKAGLCLAACANHNENELCAIVFGSENKNNLLYSFIDTKILLEYGYKNITTNIYI